MRMSHLGRALERCSRRSKAALAAPCSRTPLGYTFSDNSTAGWSPFQVMRQHHWTTLGTVESKAPFQNRSKTPQQRSIGLYLL